MNKISNNPYKDVRGFNYVPSYTLALNDVMDHYSSAIVRHELGYAKELGANSVRMWFSDVSFLRDSDEFIRNFENLLCILGDYDMTIMPTLFNRWTDRNYPIGQLDLAEALGDLNPIKENYIRSLVHAFRHDPRIILWDMCNEPFGYGKVYNLTPELKAAFTEREIRFFMQCFDAFRKESPSQPLTMGTCGPMNPVFDEIYKALDVISCHPYSGWWDDSFAKSVDELIAYTNRLDKPLICTETCQGSLDDSLRQTCIRNTLEVLKAREMGWYAWVLCAGQMVSMRRDRTDTNAKPGDRGYMCFVLADGSVRPGHEIIKEYTR